MAHGLYGYAVHLSDLNQHLGGKDLELLELVQKRFSSVIELHEKWHNSHGSGDNVLSLPEALEWLFISPVTSFDDQIGNVGYALELMAYHVGEHINLGQDGSASLREITTSDIHAMLGPISDRVAEVKLQGCSNLEHALVRRSILDIENKAAYPGTGFLTLDELKALCSAMIPTGTDTAPETWPWYPLLLLFHGAIERKRDLVTFYY
jgi:hypothetical protein